MLALLLAAALAAGAPLEEAAASAAPPPIEAPPPALEQLVEARPPLPVAPLPAAAPRSWFLLPIVFWLPETKAGLAVAGGRDFTVNGSRRVSNAFLLGAISIEGQGSIEGATEVYLRGGSLLAARLRAVHYPDAYYGVGPATPSAAREDFTRRFVELALSAELATLGGRLRAGPRAAARGEEVLDVVPGGLLATSGLPGLEGFNGVGLGGSVTWDTRDSPIWPLQGSFAQAYYVWYPAALGRNDGFGKGALDLRAFQPLGGGRVLGFSTVVETADGAAPFTLLSKLGSPRFLRGYREGRYRDRIAWAAQVELRAPIVGPLAGTVFCAAGEVAPDLAAIRADLLRPAAGIGARWRLTPGGANLRVDVAVGDEGPAAYVVLLEAF